MHKDSFADWFHKVLAVVGPVDDVTWPGHRQLPQWSMAAEVYEKWDGRHTRKDIMGKLDDLCSTVMERHTHSFLMALCHDACRGLCHCL